MDFHEIFREGLQWASEQMIKFWPRSGLPSEYRDCFADSSLLGDMESGINRLRCTTTHCRSCTSSYRHSNYLYIYYYYVYKISRQTGNVSKMWLWKYMYNLMAALCGMPTIQYSAKKRV